MSGPSTEMPVTALMESIMKDPIKRAMVLQLINKEKDNLENYKRQELKKPTTPLKTNKLHCESPTALQRRRALALRNNDTTSESSSEVSEGSMEAKGPKLPFEELLKGVTAYVEVKRDNEDRSEGIKAVMSSMGATVRDKFTNDVTHVIFKDGSFTTFEKAKLMRIHLVSVLWLDAVRRNRARVAEKNYPAFGNRVCDANVSAMCSQLLKDYEETVKDERRRRHTLMTPITSMSSYVTAQNALFSSDESTGKRPESPDVTSDDSNCGVIDGQTSKPSKNADVLSQTLESSGSLPLLSHINRTRRKTVTVPTDMIITPNIAPTSLTKSSKKIGASTPPAAESKSKKVLQSSTLQSSTMSSLRVSSESDKTASNLGNSKESEKTKSSLVSGKENCSVTTARTSMSSLRLSDSLHEESNEDKASTKSTPASKTSLGSGTSSTDKVTVRGKRTKRATSPQLELTDTSTTSASSPKNRSSSRSTRSSLNGSLSRERANNFRELDRINLDALGAGGDSPKKTGKVKSKSVSARSKDSTPTVSPSNSVQTDASESDFEEEQPRRVGRPRTSVTPQAKLVRQTPSRNRTTSSASTRRSERISMATTSPSSESSNEVQRSISATKKASIVLTCVDSEVENSNTKKKSKEVTPSPAKKSRVEASSSVKKRRRLYNPDASVCFTPPEEDKEREEYLQQKSQKSPDGVFLNPNSVNIAPLPAKQKSNNLSTQHSDEDESPKRPTNQVGKRNQDMGIRGCDEGEPKAPKKPAKKAPKKPITPVRRDSADDEQRELLDMLNQVTTTQRRNSARISLSLTKPKYTFSSTSSGSSLPITPLKRRSTLDFVSLTQKRRLKLDPKRTTSVACTKLHSAEVENFECTVKELGRYFVEDKVTKNTSHLVAGEPKRTINMLRAIARGCWILKHEWLLKSQEAGRWLNEEDYEATEFSPAVQQCRLEKEAFGPEYSMDIFKDCGYIYVGKGTTPKTADLKELISICKGKVTTVYRNASVVIGEYINRGEITCVTETWVLDSIAENRLKGYKKYLLKPGSPLV